MFSALLRHTVASGMSKTENLLSLGQPRDLGLFPLYPPGTGVTGFPQPDTHLGPHGKRSAVLPHLPTQSTETLVGHGFSPTPFISPMPDAQQLVAKDGCTITHPGSNRKPVIVFCVHQSRAPELWWGTDTFSYSPFPTHPRPRTCISELQF